MTLLLCVVSLGTRGFRTSRRVKRHGSQKQGILPAGDATRPSELPQETLESRRAYEATRDESGCSH